MTGIGSAHAPAFRYGVSASSDSSDCGHLLRSLPLNVREWVCAECGTVHDRDVNAARTILAAGLAVSARGDGVRPPRS